MIELYLEDNIVQLQKLYEKKVLVDLIYADCIYESRFFDWFVGCLWVLKPNGILIIQTDWHTVADYKQRLDAMGLTFINHLVWKNEWGNHPKDRFHQCYDDILIYCNGDSWKFYSERIQVPKATVNTKLNPSGRQTKTATAWIDDICLTTTSKERVRQADGHLIKWQKPIRLLDRILLPFSDEGDLILDPFLGSGTTGVWCKRNNRNFIGIENNEEVFKIARERIIKW